MAKKTAPPEVPTARANWRAALLADAAHPRQTLRFRPSWRAIFCPDISNGTPPVRSPREDCRRPCADLSASLGLSLSAAGFAPEIDGGTGEPRYAILNSSAKMSGL